MKLRFASLLVLVAVALVPVWAPRLQALGQSRDWWIAHTPAYIGPLYVDVWEDHVVIGLSFPPPAPPPPVPTAVTTTTGTPINSYNGYYGGPTQPGYAP